MLYNYPKIKLNYIKAFTITSLIAIIVFYFSSWMVYKQKVLGGGILIVSYFCFFYCHDSLLFNE
ncbi:hypothetical protein B6N31_16965 [Dickeya fangzhongdai]|nr:hypothetical protein B6N31_16965 [Dickeya fangzhongdai]